MFEPMTSPPAREALPTRCKAPGTCGEFVQGAIDGVDFLVNCPIDLYSRATVRPGRRAGVHLRNADQYRKAADTIALLSQGCRLELRHEVAVDSEIPRGKGMASSTADITAAVEALCRSCAVRLPARALARFLAEVEPSDCVHFPGIAHVHHLTGELVESLPAPRNLRVLVVDCGGEVDTVEFDRDRARHVYARHQPEIAGALALLRRGLRERDARAVGEAATRSARLSQRILPKPPFDELLAKATRAGALGVNCAHSGTVLGVLYEADAHLAEDLVDLVQKTFGSSVRIQGDHRIIGGGCHGDH